MSADLTMAYCAPRAASQVATLSALLDHAHANGLAIPPAVARAMQTLAALPIAWASNAAGQPAPAYVKAALGLTDTKGTTDE